MREQFVEALQRPAAHRGPARLQEDLSQVQRVHRLEAQREARRQRVVGRGGGFGLGQGQQSRRARLDRLDRDARGIDGAARQGLA